ncbi:MAG: phage tail protein [Betaproteobacteria bacterium]|nr:phage tail protein [Betaproteobacteria bacterium]
MTAAINKTGDKARAEMTRQITSEFSIKARDVRAQLILRRASVKGAGFVAELEAFGRRGGKRSMNVIHFRARQTAQGVTVQIKKTGGRKLLKHAFIGNQGRTVFMRAGKQRLPIQAVETIDVPQMFNTRRINTAVLAKIKRELPVEFERALSMLARRGR